LVACCDPQAIVARFPDFGTNVCGILNVLRAVLPTLRAQRSGRIINLSSIGGFIGSAGWGIYCATKFAVEGFSEALARGPLRIDVNHAQPGDPVKAAIRSGLNGPRRRCDEELAIRPCLEDGAVASTIRFTCYHPFRRQGCRSAVVPADSQPCCQSRR
jgi:NAD(P)-dependent dehydrogenase (short-subunit alcohol dehydrogenase family)